MERKPIEPGKIVMREFRLVKGQIDSPYDFKISGIQHFDYHVDFETGINLEQDLIRADFKVSIKTKSEGNAIEATGGYHFVFVFHYDKLSEHAAIVASNEIDWNPYLANAIASITYSTSRGILLSRFQGTVMESFILPVVDPNWLMQTNTMASTQKIALLG